MTRHFYKGCNRRKKLRKDTPEVSLGASEDILIQEICKTILILCVELLMFGIRHTGWGAQSWTVFARPPPPLGAVRGMIRKPDGQWSKPWRKCKDRDGRTPCRHGDGCCWRIALRGTELYEDLPEPQRQQEHCSFEKIPRWWPGPDTLAKGRKKLCKQNERQIKWIYAANCQFYWWTHQCWHPLRASEKACGPLGPKDISWREIHVSARPVYTAKTTQRLLVQFWFLAD